MDCRSYKELLDSYLCQELAVETNHQMLSHAEHCPSCRAEMASRRNVREALRRACSKDCLSNEVLERMRSRLRADAAVTTGMPASTISWWARLAELFRFRILVPASVAILALAIGGSLYLKRQNSPSPAFLLSDLLMTEAAYDHRECAPHFLESTKTATMPDSVGKYDEAYLALDKIASSGAANLTLRAAHVCQPGTRQFAHLVYTRGENLISLLVTKRDGRALKTGELPDLETSLFGLQKANNGELSIGAHQTSKHIVLVVSDLPKFENEKLMEALSLPVLEHLRRLDNRTANAFETDLQNLNLFSILRRREIK